MLISFGRELKVVVWGKDVGVSPEPSGSVGGYWPEALRVPEIRVGRRQWPSRAMMLPEAQRLKERVLDDRPGEPFTSKLLQKY